MKKHYSEINEKDAGLTLEQYLRQTLKFTKAQIRSMKFRNNGLLVNGERTRVNYILREGDKVVLQMEEETEASTHLIPTEGPLEILYEDRDLIAVWKESGVVVHPSHGHYQDTLSNRLHRYFRKKGEAVTIRSIGRLDRDTSGILIFAKNQVAAARLWKQKEEGIFWKEYLALCEGVMDQTDDSLEDTAKEWYTIDASIGKMDGEFMKMCVREDGQRAVTHYQILKCTSKHTLVRVRIDTGRTHQIRVHMASIGHPLVGDILYNAYIDRENGTEHNKNSLQLCAWKAELQQPFTMETVTIERKKDKFDKEPSEDERMEGLTS